MDTHNIYMTLNEDWHFLNKCKYGYVYGGVKNLINRINDSTEQHSERSKYTHIFEIKSDKYTLPYVEIDKIFSLFTKQLNSVETCGKFPLLTKLKDHLIISKTKTSNEFIKLSGVDLIEQIIQNEFPLIGLFLVKKYNTNELNDINQSVKLNTHVQLLDNFNWTIFWHNFEQKNNLPMSLKGYQINAYPKIKSIVNNMSSETYDYIIRLYIMCRCGKTELFKRFAYEYQDKFTYIIYVCSRLTLIDDMIKRWVNMIPDFIIVEISSSGSPYNITDDEFKKNIRTNNKMLIFICDKSFNRLRPLLKNDTDKLFIFDEAHYLVTKQTDTHPL
jgi:hypothetical protein